MHSLDIPCLEKKLGYIFMLSFSIAISMVNVHVQQLIDHFEIEQGTGTSCKFDPIYKLTPPYKRSCQD